MDARLASAAAETDLTRVYSFFAITFRIKTTFGLHHGLFHQVVSYNQQQQVSYKL